MRQKAGRILILIAMGAMTTNNFLLLSRIRHMAEFRDKLLAADKELQDANDHLMQASQDLEATMNRVCYGSDR